MSSIHPLAIDWQPSPPRPGVSGRTTAYESRLGIVWRGASGLWNTEAYNGVECGEHRTRQLAQKAVEDAKP